MPTNSLSSTIVEKNKPISSLTVEDCIDYRDFLWNLGRMTPDEWSKRFKVAQDRWIGTRGAPRWSQFWRPFEGPLKSSSQKTALVIVQSMCQWLTDQHYFHGNPFKSVGKLAKRVDRIDVTRALTNAEWKAIKGYLASTDTTPRYYRLRFILVLAYSTGSRLSELVSMRRRDLRHFMRDDESYQQWEIWVTGKGDVVVDGKSVCNARVNLSAYGGIRRFVVNISFKFKRLQNWQGSLSAKISRKVNVSANLTLV